MLSIENCHPLATKLRDLKMFKMAFQVVFSAKKFAKVQFCAFGSPKAEKTRGGAIMAPPRVTTSFQSLGKIGLIELKELMESTELIESTKSIESTESFKSIELTESIESTE